MKKYPKYMACLIAGSVIEEVNKKRTITGLYPGDEVIFDGFDGSLPIILASLSIICKFIGASKPHEFNGQIIGPSNNILMDIVKANLNPSKMNIAVMFINFNPFPINEFGLHTLKAILDGEQEYTYQFNIDKEALKKPLP